MYLENTYDKDKLIYKYTGINEIPYDMEVGTKLGKVELYNGDTLLTTVEIELKEKQSSAMGTNPFHWRPEECKEYNFINFR